MDNKKQSENLTEKIRAHVNNYLKQCEETDRIEDELEEQEEERKKEVAEKAQAT